MTGPEFLSAFLSESSPPRIDGEILTGHTPAQGAWAINVLLGPHLFLIPVYATPSSSTISPENTDTLGLIFYFAFSGKPSYSPQFPGPLPL